MFDSDDPDDCSVSAAPKVRFAFDGASSVTVALLVTPMTTMMSPADHATPVMALGVDEANRLDGW